MAAAKVGAKDYWQLPVPYISSGRPPQATSISLIDRVTVSNLQKGLARRWQHSCCECGCSLTLPALT